jgi:hypothetical protein
VSAPINDTRMCVYTSCAGMCVCAQPLTVAELKEQLRNRFNSHVYCILLKYYYCSS